MRLFSGVQRALRERLTPAGWVVLSAAGISAAAGVDTTQTVTYQAFTFFAVLIVAATAWSSLRKEHVTVIRELPRYATAGEPFAYPVTVRNRHGARLGGAVVLERIADPRPSYDEWRAAREPGERRRNWFDRSMGYFRWEWLLRRKLPRRMSEAALPDLPAGGEATIRLEMTPRRRGRLEFAGVTLGRADPLGLVKRLTRVPLPARVTALPKRYRVPQLALPGRRKFQQGGVSLAASVGDSEEFIGLRDYRPGDPLQKLHWKSFARTGRPIVREYQDEFFERHALLLDTGRDEGEDAAFEEAVAASFVYTIDTRECLLDLLFVGERVHAYTAGRGQLSAEHLLEVLAAVAPTPREEFDEMARVARLRMGAMSSCILVFVSWDRERRELAQALIAAGLTVRAVLVSSQDPESQPAWLHVLRPGEIEAGLARLA
jgi:uncharacterized protein (DUF58 family)